MLSTDWQAGAAVPDLAACRMHAQLYESVDESPFAEFDPL